MHAFQLRLIQRKIFEAMTSLAAIEAGFSGIDEPITEAFVLHCRTVQKTYLHSLGHLGLLRPALLNPREILSAAAEEAEENAGERALSHRVKALIRQGSAEDDSYVPLQFSDLRDSAIWSYTGIVFTRKNGGPLFTVLYESKMPVGLIQPAGYKNDSLTPMLEKLARENNVNLAEICEGLNTSFRQLQADSRAFYGDTFYRMLIKIRILNAVSDLLFTDLTYKETAYKNHFTDYNNMYRSFRKYSLRPGEVPRLMGC